MKYLVYVLFFGLMFMGCSNDGTSPKSDILSGSWDITNISGGFAGIQDDYEPRTITWTFNATTLKLSVANNNDQEGVLYDGLASGEYDYTIVNLDNKQFLEIDGQEFSGFSITDKELKLDQNQTTAGTGADGFVLLFRLRQD